MISEVYYFGMDFNKSMPPVMLILSLGCLLERTLIFDYFDYVTIIDIYQIGIGDDQTMKESLSISSKNILKRKWECSSVDLGPWLMIFVLIAGSMPVLTGLLSTSIRKSFNYSYSFYVHFVNNFGVYMYIRHASPVYLINQELLMQQAFLEPLGMYPL